MPYVHCLTSQVLDAAKEESFKAGAAAALSEVAGKAENWLFVSCQGGQTLFVRGAKVPGAVIQVSLVGTLSKAQKKELSSRFCRLCQEALGVPMDSTYAVFGEVAGENWGWNGNTFG